MKNYIITLIFILVSMFTFTSCEKDYSYELVSEKNELVKDIEQIKVTEVAINLFDLSKYDSIPGYILIYNWDNEGDEYYGDSVYYSDHYRDVVQYVTSQSIKGITLYDARTVVQSLTVNQLAKCYDDLNLSENIELHIRMRISQFQGDELLGFEDIGFNIKSDDFKHIPHLSFSTDETTGIKEVR